jgi:hypothetical protein
MFKVLVFLESDLPRMEDELNKYKGWDFAHAWSTSNNRIVVLLKERAKPGRPVTKEE